MKKWSRLYFFSKRNSCGSNDDFDLLRFPLESSSKSEIDCLIDYEGLLILLESIDSSESSTRFWFTGMCEAKPVIGWPRFLLFLLSWELTLFNLRFGFP